MCGFAVSNITRLQESNYFCQRRGPDLTNSVVVNGIEFLHNLLHITGEVVKQPLIKKDIVCVFNGEIYNYRSFGSYKSDGECLIDLYDSQGDEFVKLLDGEFALCLIDFRQGKIIIANDTFACKPIWYEISKKSFCIASYNSQLVGLGLKNGKKLYANTTQVYNLRTLEKQKEFSNTIFDLRQYKKSFDGWLEAFGKSIKKRTENTKEGMFVGLSSGYDSGAISCELEKQKINFKAYSIINNENMSVLQKRFERLSNTQQITMTESNFNNWKTNLESKCEDFTYDDKFKSYNIKSDQAAIGLSMICNLANNENRKIYFSGQGADEIISDYGFNGQKFFKHSEFGGLFPEDLHGFFPWHSFYDGTQIKYLNKEEYVAGAFGIETRYPFLDRDLVQEFLWLSPKLKNSKYKSVLDEYLTVNKFPFSPSEKLGFHVTKKKNKK